MYSPNGHRVPLGVPVPSPGVRVPDDALVEHVLGAGVDHAADQDGDPDGLGGLLDVGVDRAVLERVDGRGVLRPEHERGLGLVTGGDLVGEPGGGVDVVLGHLPVVEQDVVAVAGHVALHDRDRRLVGHVGRVRRQGRQQRDREDAAQRQRGDESVAAVGEDEPGQAGAQQRQQQADAAVADVREGLLPGRPRRGVGEPPPGHAAERPAGPDRLHRHPGDGEQDRPRAVAVEHGRDQPEQPVEHRLHAREGRPRVVADHAHPEHQDVAEGDPEDEAREPGTAHGQVVGDQDEGGHGERDDVGGAHRLERQRQDDARHGGGNGPEQHAGKGTGACAERRKDLRPFGPTRGRLDADTEKLSRGREVLPYPPSRSENRPPRTMS